MILIIHHNLSPDLSDQSTIPLSEMGVMRVFVFLSSFCVSLSSSLLVKEYSGYIHHKWSLVSEMTDSLSSLSLSSAHTQFPLTFALKQQNIDQLHTALMNVSSPSHPLYGKYWKWERILEVSRPSQEAVETVWSFLRSHGLSSYEISSGFLRVHVDIETANRILSTKYQLFQHENGKRVFRCLKYSLPEHVAQHLDFVEPTIKFPSFASISPESYQLHSDVNFYQNTPENLRKLYQIGETWGGKSNTRQAVTAFLQQYYSETDLQSFYSQYFPKLSGTPISLVIGPNEGTSGLEASLDVEYLTSVGAGVPTELWSFGGEQPGNIHNEPFLDWLYLLGNTSSPPHVFSTSYAEDESSVSFEYAERMNQEFLKNSLRGITFLFASGDSGVGSLVGNCVEYSPQYPADSPYVTSVGATTHIDPEMGATLSSGGFSNRWTRQSWQEKAIDSYLHTSPKLPQSRLYNATGRGFPDVSAQGTAYVVVNDGITLPSVDGTSCATPTFGGIISLLNDLRISLGKSPLGFLNPLLYSHPEIFNDVTEGNNPGCGTDGFFATSGWDPITGMGTPNFPAMMELISNLP